jgi:hypothetical protein
MDLGETCAFRRQRAAQVEILHIFFAYKFCIYFAR